MGNAGLLVDSNHREEFSTAVEFSQLYHVRWLDTIRRTTLGGLILGWGFSWGDLLAYAGGVAVCFIIDRQLTQKATRSDL